MANSSSSADINIFKWKPAIFVISRNTGIGCLLFESLKVVLINMVAILMMSTKLATLGLLEIKVF